MKINGELLFDAAGEKTAKHKEIRIKQLNFGIEAGIAASAKNATVERLFCENG